MQMKLEFHINRCLCDNIESRPALTLSEMKDTLFANKGIRISITSIAKYLEGNLITLKELDLIPINRNCSDVNVKRVRKLLSQHEAGATFCYVDECVRFIYCKNSRLCR